MCDNGLILGLVVGTKVGNCCCLKCVFQFVLKYIRGKIIDMAKSTT